MNEDLVHIALAANHRYAPGLRATVVSMILAASEPERLRFHVFSDGMTAEDERGLSELVRRFGYRYELDFRQPDMSVLAARFKEFRGSIAPFLRLLFPDILGDLDWVLWSDVDTLWFRDPIRFWEEREDSVPLVWSKDTRASRLASAKAARFPIGASWDRYACSGVLLMNLRRMRDDGFVAQCFDFVEKYGSPLFADQDILNYFCAAEAKLVDPRWDLLYPVPSLEGGAVLHLTGIGRHFNDCRYTGFSPRYEIWFRFCAQCLEGRRGAVVASWPKRALFNALSLLYPCHRLVAVVLDHVWSKLSMFVQRSLLYAWVRRLRLWNDVAVIGGPVR